MTSRERVLAMLNGAAVDRVPLMPITMMFAADHIGVPYRAYATDHRVMAEAQVKTAETFGFDYVSTISDPAREAADLGATVEYFDDQPPALNEHNALLSDKATLLNLHVPDIEAGNGRRADRVAGVALMRQKVGDQLAVEGWVEGPCAQGADLRGINTLMLDFHDDPAFVRDLFEFIVQLELAFAQAQVEAGADLIGVGDAAASLVGPKIYAEQVWPYEAALVKGIQAMGAKVRLHICGRTRKLFTHMGHTGADQIDLDWMAPLDEARQQMGPKQVLYGNIDPVSVLRNGTPEVVAAAIAECHRQAGERYIAGAGCEVCRDTPEANLRALCSYAQQSLTHAAH